MSTGKAASQAGHAFLDTFLRADLQSQAMYFAGGEGTKVVLAAEDEEHLRRLHQTAFDQGLPCALVTERDHIHPPHFDGRPIITALGIGPAPRERMRNITKRLPLMR